MVNPKALSMVLTPVANAAAGATQMVTYNQFIEDLENKEYKIYHEHTKILDKKLIGGLSCRLLRFSRFSRQPTFLYYGCRIERKGGAINDTERNETSGYFFSGR